VLSGVIGEGKWIGRQKAQHTQRGEAATKDGLAAKAHKRSQRRKAKDFGRNMGQKNTPDPHVSAQSRPFSGGPGSQCLIQNFAFLIFIVPDPRRRAKCSIGSVPFHWLY